MGRDSGPVFITGATGSIGTMLARRLSEMGRRVRALVRDPRRAGKLQALGDIEIVQGDLSLPDSIHGSMQDCSLAYHCAAKLAGSNWKSFRAINVEGTRALLREAERAGVGRFVHISTIGVYACSEAQNIGEDFPWPAGPNPYFTTKQEAERAAWEAARGVPITVARLGDVFGPGQHVWTVDLLVEAKRGLLQPPTDQDSGYFNPTYIENTVDALVLLGLHPAAVGQAFNVVDGTPTLFSEYIRRLGKMAGKRMFAVPGFAILSAAWLLKWLDLLRGREALVKPEDAAYLLHKGTISGAKIRSALGWKPNVDVDMALCRTEEWLRNEGYLS